MSRSSATNAAIHRRSETELRWRRCGESAELAAGPRAFQRAAVAVARPARRRAVARTPSSSSEGSSPSASVRSAAHARRAGGPSESHVPFLRLGTALPGSSVADRANPGNGDSGALAPYWRGVQGACARVPARLDAPFADVAGSAWGGTRSLAVASLAWLALPCP